MLDTHMKVIEMKTLLPSLSVHISRSLSVSVYLYVSFRLFLRLSMSPDDYSFIMITLCDVLIGVCTYSLTHTNTSATYVYTGT